VKRARLIAIVKLALAATTAMLACSLVVYLVAPPIAPIAAVAVALLIVLVELGRLRESVERRMDELGATRSRSWGAAASSRSITTRGTSRRPERSSSSTG
jgi:hypothetical protein